MKICFGQGLLNLNQKKPLVILNVNQANQAQVVVDQAQVVVD